MKNITTLIEINGTPEQTWEKKVKNITTSIEINATPEQIWEILVDFANYPSWNPFIKSVIGNPSKGAKLDIIIQPPSQKAMRFTPKIIVLEQKRELRWLGRVLIPGLFDGEHRFKITPLNANTVRFTQSENFSGLLVPLFGKVLEKARLGFEEMNQALKSKAEN